jgi:hypothetical protein
VKKKEELVKKYKNELQMLLLRFFKDHQMNEIKYSIFLKDHQMNSVKLNAITQTVLDKTRHLQLYKLYNSVDEPKQQYFMMKILQDTTVE